MNFQKVIGSACLLLFTFGWFAEAGERTVITLHSAVNIRSGAGTQNSILGKIEDKEEAQVIGRKVLKNGQEWLRIRLIRHPNYRKIEIIGWVAGRFFVNVESRDAESRDEKPKSEDCPDCNVRKKSQSLTVKDFEAIADKIANQRNQGFIWPVAGQIRSGFGNRRHPIKGVVKFHKGVDIAGNNGKTVSAAKAGKVTLSYGGCKNGNKNCNGGGGNWIEISHSDGTKTRYLHMSSRCRIPKIGATLKQGDPIGCVGATGAVTGPHLHFRVMKNGRYINPLSALPKRKG